MHSPFVGEFVGTLVLSSPGRRCSRERGAERSKAEGPDGWLSPLAGASRCWRVFLQPLLVEGSDAHINPAVTLGFAVMTGNYSKVAPFIIAQMLGAFVGAVLVWLHFLPHWKETPDASLKLLVFCTAPAIRYPIANLVSEIIGTFVLVFEIAAAIASK